MKKVLVYGTTVIALSAAPLLAQQPSGGSRTQSGAGTDTAGGQAGAGASQPRPSQPATDTAGSNKPAEAKTSQSQASKETNPDHSFVMEAAMGSMAEVELGRLAGEKAQSDQVKQFAQRMVSDHGKANDELKTLAQNKNISLPTDPGAKHKATKDRLSKMSGAAFDKAYMQEMLNDHRKDVSDFQKESRSGKDPDVKAWAAKTLPTLQEHLQLAQTASRGAVGTSGTKPGSDTDKPTGGTAPRSGGTSTTPSGGSTSSPGGATGSSSPR
jgi:putative membrane protein